MARCSGIPAQEAQTPRLMALRAVSLPATARRMRPRRCSEPGASPRSLCTRAEVRSSCGFARTFLGEPVHQHKEAHAGVHERRHGVPSPMKSGRRHRGSICGPEHGVELAAGMPTASQITSRERLDRVSTARPPLLAHMPSMTSVQIVHRVEHVLQLLGVNDLDDARWRAWRGSSMLMNEPKKSSASTGRSGMAVAPRRG